MNRDDIKALVEIDRLDKALQAKPKPPQGKDKHQREEKQC